MYSWEELGVKNHDEAVEYVMDDLKKTLTGMVRAIFGQVKHRPNILSRQPQTFCPKPQTLQQVSRIPPTLHPNPSTQNPRLCNMYREFPQPQTLIS